MCPERGRTSRVRAASEVIVMPMMFACLPLGHLFAITANKWLSARRESKRP